MDSYHKRSSALVKDCTVDEKQDRNVIKHFNLVKIVFISKGSESDVFYSSFDYDNKLKFLLSIAERPIITGHPVHPHFLSTL